MESALEAVGELAREGLAQTGVPGLAVGVLAGGERAVRAWGVEDLGSGAPVTERSTFRVASVTKPFTASLARAVLDLEEPLDTPAGAVSPRLLLAHVGGLRCEAARPLHPYATVSEAVAAGGLSAWGEPGRLWVYANAGYWLVGAAVERTTGGSFEDAMAEHVLAPARLDEVGFEPPSATGHEPVRATASDHRAYPAPEYPVSRRPSGGLVATAGGLLPFAEAAFDDAEASVAVAERPGGLQGAGWMLETRGEEELLLHPGSAGG